MTSSAAAGPTGAWSCRPGHAEPGSAGSAGRISLAFDDGGTDAPLPQALPDLHGDLAQTAVVNHDAGTGDLTISSSDAGALGLRKPLDVVAHAGADSNPKPDGGRHLSAAGSPAGPEPGPGVTAAAIERAAADLAPYLRPTPLQFSRAITAKVRCEVHLKLEGVQPIRAFKVRGALNKVIRMSPAERARGVVTASAGNHGQGVAYSALAFGIPATVYVPARANPLKVESIRRMGARVIEHGASYQEAFLEAQARAGQMTFIHAYDDPEVIAGQGTIGVELLAALAAFDTVIIPIGGGGLIAGIATYLKERMPAARIIGVEPSGAACMKRSFEAGRPVTLERVSTIADGLAASRPGTLCFEIARRCVDELLIVEEDEMLRAIRLYFSWEHLLAEPAGAAALAGLLYRYSPSPGERVVVLLSGANVTDEVMLRALKSR